MFSGRKEVSLGLVCAPSDLRYVEEIVLRSGTSFGRGMKILPLPRRQGMFAIYAFCRVVDDIADGDTLDKDPMQALMVWRDRISDIYNGKTSDELDRVLYAAIERYNLQQDDFVAVIDGMAMDCGEPIIAPDEKTFDIYCDRVASAVGRLSVRIFGLSSEKGDRLSHHLGRALQITNILRDVSEDANRGRLYLPKDLLERFSVPIVPVTALHSLGFNDVCNIMAARASDHFLCAERVMSSCNKDAVRPARMMAAVYKTTLTALKKRGWKEPNSVLHFCSWQKNINVLLAYIGISL